MFLGYHGIQDAYIFIHLDMMHCKLASYTYQTVNANREVSPQELIVIGDFPFCVLQLC